MRLFSLGINILLSLNLAFGSVFTGDAATGHLLQKSEPPVRIDGFGVDMNALPALNVENVEFTVQNLAVTGVSYIRQEIDWSLIETSPGVYDWSSAVPLDLLFATASARKIQIVAVLTGGPVYLASSGQPVSRSAVRERWSYFVQAAVEQFGAYVDIWEIGSAVNSSYALTPFLSPLSPDQAIGPNATYYSKLLGIASDVIRDADPNDQVWLGSLTGLFDLDCAMNPLTFLLELNASRSWKDFDAILYTPMQGSAAPEFPSSGTVNSACASNLMATPGSITDEVRAVQELARQLGGKPVLISRLSWRTDELAALSGNREIPASQVEADLLVRASAALMAQNAIPVIFWSADILNNQSAQYALANLQQLLHNTKPLGRVAGQDEAVHEYHFRKGGQHTVIAWHARDGDLTYPAALQVGDIRSLTAWTADSAELSRENGQLIPADGNQQASVVLNERPVIFSGRSGDIIINIRYSIEDQTELAQIELSQLMKRWLNEAKSEFVHLLEKELDKAKDSALEWGEDKLDELLP